MEVGGKGGFEGVVWLGGEGVWGVVWLGGEGVLGGCLVGGREFWGVVWLGGEGSFGGLFGWGERGEFWGLFGWGGRGVWGVVWLGEEGGRIGWRKVVWLEEVEGGLAGGGGEEGRGPSGGLFGVVIMFGVCLVVFKCGDG